MGTYTPPKITGYRQLSEIEVALINRAKALDTAASLLVDDIAEHLRVQWQTGRLTVGEDLEVAGRMNNAQPERWLAMGRTDLQVGVMKIVRSIAQPAT